MREVSNMEKAKLQTLPLRNNFHTPTPINYGFIRNCVRCFANYSNATTIHGFNYLVESGRSVTERVSWLVAMAMSISTCIFLIMSIYQKWISMPVIVTFANKETSIFEIPFPALTICPEVKANNSMFNYTDIYLKKLRNFTLTANESKHFEYMSLICETPPELLNGDKTVDSEALDYLLEVGPHANDFAFGLQWMGYNVVDGVSHFFTPVLTDEGLCYTLNIMDKRELFTDIVKYPGRYFVSHYGRRRRSDWFPDTGYGKNESAGTYPLRSSSAGISGGLLMALRFRPEDFDYACRKSIQGYKIALHLPSEFPLVKENYVRIPLDHAITFEFQPNMMTTSPDLKDYKAQIRGCYFMTEKKLKYFRIYNQQNCLLECLKNITFEMCGCISFYMPREEFTPICSASNNECVLRAKKVGYVEECDCLSSCNEVKFDVITSHAVTHMKKRSAIAYAAGTMTEEKYLKFVHQDRYVIAELNFYFKEASFLRSERNKLFDKVDFWANVGGLLGLFTGLSFLSVCEILYHASLRLFYNARLYGRRYWAGSA